MNRRSRLRPPPAPVLLSLLTAALYGTARADSLPTGGVVNFESAHVSPLAVTPDGTRLLAVKTAAAGVMIYEIAAGGLAPVSVIPTGLDPVTVRARTDNEVWVVNQVSDSVTVLNPRTGIVTATIRTDNEPADVVFAGNPQRAFVSCMQTNTVLVFDPANLAAAPARIALSVEEPRSLAVSPDGARVYAAGFRTGNGTVVLNGRSGPITTGLGSGSENVVSRPEGPYAGVNPPPNRGAAFFPPITAAGTPPKASMIVRKAADGRWLDDNSGDWSLFVSGGMAPLTRRVAGWDLPDRDVAVINTATLAVSYQTRVMNILMAMAVRPGTGEVTVAGTEALNEVRYEPNLNGVFLRVNLARFAPGGETAIRDLNPHLDYTAPTVPAETRNQSLGDPRGMAWTPDGSAAFITGMGSDNVAVSGPGGERLATIPVGAGPTGIAIAPGNTNRAYVLNRFDASLSILDTAARTEILRVPFTDPTPAAVREGRPFLYSTHRTSGLGHVSCASCHVDGRTDHLSWDLGNPAGAPESTGEGKVLHPMKGPMLTQTLQDIIRHPRLHWRGDRAGIEAFHGAFLHLQGAETGLTAGEMAKLRAFLDTIHFPPNPYRNANNTLPTSLKLPDGTSASASAGRTELNRDCLPCHTNGKTRSEKTDNEVGQSFIPGQFAGFYDRLGYDAASVSGSTNGSGYFHDGADPLYVATRARNLTAAILTFEGPGFGLTGNTMRRDAHPAVGRQVTVNASNAAAARAEAGVLVAYLTGSTHLAMTATGVLGGTRRSFAGTTPTLSSDKAGESRTVSWILDRAVAGEAFTFTLVPRGTEKRLATDRNLNGVPDLDESAPTTWPVWAASRGLTDGVLGDRDGDLVPNLLEYALAGDTGMGTSPSPPGISILGAASAFSYSRPRGLTDVHYLPEMSATLLPGSWTALPGAPTVTPNADNTESVVWSDVFTRAGFTERGFFRLKTSLTEGATAVTAATGFYRLPAPRGNSPWTAGLTRRPFWTGTVLATGAADSAGRRVLTVSSAAFQPGTLAGCYAEIISPDSLRGTVLDIRENSPGTITVNDYAEAGAADTRLVIRPHVTLGALFPGGGGFAPLSDSVTIFSADGSRKPYFWSSNPGPGRWIDALGADATGTVIRPGAGIMLQTSAPRSLLIGLDGDVSWVKPGPLRFPLTPGVNNWTGPLNPLGETVPLSGIGYQSALRPLNDSVSIYPADGTLHRTGVYLWTGSGFVNGAGSPSGDLPVPPGSAQVVNTGTPAVLILENPVPDDVSAP